MLDVEPTAVVHPPRVLLTADIIVISFLNGWDFILIPLMVCCHSRVPANRIQSVLPISCFRHKNPYKCSETPRAKCDIKSKYLENEYSGNRATNVHRE